jgi:hypothetical protein
MNDPHVQSLTYRLETGPSLSFINASPLDHETEYFRIRLEAEKLTVLMTEHHITVESARARVTPFLRTWELEHYLRNGPNAIHFVFEDAEVIDRRPRAEGHTYVHLARGGMKITGSNMDTIFRPSKYPEPPSRLGVSPDVETMWNRLEGFHQGREPLTSMAYFCLTVVEVTGGGTARGRREAAAKRYALDLEVLDKLGALVSERGNEDTARKFRPNLEPLRPEDETWIIAVVRLLIRRLAQIAAGVDTLDQVTMKGLPPL